MNRTFYFLNLTLCRRIHLPLLIFILSSFLAVHVQYLLCLELDWTLPPPPPPTDLTPHTITPAICATAVCLQKHVRCGRLHVNERESVVWLCLGPFVSVCVCVCCFHLQTGVKD